MRKIIIPLTVLAVAAIFSFLYMNRSPHEQISSRADTAKENFKGTSAMEHSFFTMKDSKSPDGDGTEGYPEMAVPDPNPTPTPLAKAPDTAALTTRQKYASEKGVPVKYKTLTNPLEPTAENIAAGKKTFGSRCAMCHGKAGLGDGPAGAALKPKPSNLSVALTKVMVTDGYIFWAITEGGAPLGTSMLSFKSLPEPERWKIILYLRAEIEKRN